MDPIHILLLIGITIFISHFFTAIFEKTKIPDVLLLILLGILLQICLYASGYGMEEFTTLGPIISSLALALMLFEGGSHLTFQLISKTLARCLMISILTFIVTSILASISLYLFFWGMKFVLVIFEYIVSDISILEIQPSVLQCLFFGSVIGSVSPAVIVPLLKMMELTDKTKSMLVVESAVSDVLSIVFSIGLLSLINDSYYQEDSSSFISIDTMILDLVFTIGCSSLLGILGAFLWSWILKKIRSFPNTIFTSLAFIVILYSVAEIYHHYHFNGPLSVLVFGLILANSNSMPFNSFKSFAKNHLVEFTEIEKTFFSEILFMVKTFFFIYLGSQLFNVLTNESYNVIFFIFGMMVTLLIYVGRILIAKYMLPMDIGYYDTKIISFMIPKGLAAAVLAEYYLQYANLQGVVTFDYIRIIIYSIVFWSIVLTALMYIFNNSNYLNSTYKVILFSKYRQINEEVENEINDGNSKQDSNYTAY